jgi:hypothetical protein
MVQLDDPVNVIMFQYLGYLSLMIVYLYLVLVYPIKGVITQTIGYFFIILGSLYGYLYGLSFIVLLGLWPLYCIVEEFAVNSSITLSIIFNNRALVMTFIVILIFSFYILVHNVFFEGDKSKMHKILKKLFNQ